MEFKEVAFPKSHIGHKIGETIWRMPRKNGFDLFMETIEEQNFVLNQQRFHATNKQLHVL